MLSFEFLKGLFARHEYMCSSTVYTANLSYFVALYLFGEHFNVVIPTNPSYNSTDNRKKILPRKKYEIG